MSTVLAVLLVVVIAAAVAGIGYATWLAAKKRREAFAAMAAQRGWTYAQRDDRYVNQFSGVAPFGVGHDRRATNVVTGAHDGRNFMAFDYRYTTTEHYTDAQGKSQTRTKTHPYSVIALAIGRSVPEL